MAQVDYFLKIDGIEGESQDDRHRDEIDLLSMSWGLASSGTAVAAAGGGAGKVTFQDVSFTKRLDKATPQLFLHCAQGKHISKAVVFASRAGENRQEFYEITLSNCIVSSFQQGASSGDEIPIESFSLNFAKIEVSYSPQKEDGTLDSPVKAGWDLKANKAV